jgi:pyruvate dehydrogenase (quinone)
VEVVFGLPGDGINGIMEALRTRQDTIRFIQVRHSRRLYGLRLRQVHR